jgi:hypothetical protein
LVLFSFLTKNLCLKEYIYVAIIYLFE